MTNTSLAESYLKKAQVRLDVLRVYPDREAYSDAQHAFEDAAWVVSVAGRVISP